MPQASRNRSIERLFTMRSWSPCMAAEVSNASLVADAWRASMLPCPVKLVGRFTNLLFYNWLGQDYTRLSAHLSMPIFLRGDRRLSIVKTREASGRITERR